MEKNDTLGYSDDDDDVYLREAFEERDDSEENEEQKRKRWKELKEYRQILGLPRLYSKEDIEKFPRAVSIEGI